MRDDLTELVFILDSSGSMFGLESDTIGGFNSVINQQKNVVGKAFVTTVFFNHKSQIIHDRVDIQQIKPLTAQDYTAQGSTALLDAIGDTINHIRHIHQYAREEDVPSRTIVVITTDGLENASKVHSLEEVKKLIIHQKQEKGWEFLFLGANIDAIQVAQTMGISPECTANYHSDSQGTEITFSSIDDALTSYRCCHWIDTNWKDKLDADYQKRRRQKS